MKSAKTAPHRPSSFVKALRLTLALLFFTASGFFFWVYYERFYRHEFNELGRCYDPVNGIVYTTSGFIWILPAVFFLLIGLRQFIFRNK